MALETVLLAVGPGDEGRAEKLARTLLDIAGPAGAKAVLAHVFTDEEFESTIENLDIESASDVTPDEVAGRHTTIRTISRRIEAEGLDYEIRGAVGPHGEEIVDLATEIGADLVIVGGRKRSPTGKAVFGSTAQEVMLSAPCPVTFVRDE